MAELERLAAKLKEKTINSILRVLYRGVLGYHRMLSKRFPFAIYYDLHKDEIRIWRVLDCRREPRWLKLQLTRARKL